MSLEVFESSILLERLARASLQAALLAALVWLATRPARGMRAGARAALWLLVAVQLLLGLALPAFELPLLPAASPRRVVGATPPGVAASGFSAAVEPAPVAALPEATGAPSSSRTRSRAGSANVTLLAIGGWLLGVAAVSAHQALGLLRLRRLLASAREPNDPRLRVLLLAAGRPGQRLPRLLVSEQVSSPFVTGLLRPAVVLPATLAREPDAPALRMTLAHELGHLERRDLWLALIPAAARALFYFHPVAWLAEREHRLAREAACDERVVLGGFGNAHDYGRLLVGLGTNPAAPAFGASGVVTSRSVLRRRLEMLENLIDRPARAARLAWLSALLAVAATLPFRVVAAEPPPGDAEPVEVGETPRPTSYAVPAVVPPAPAAPPIRPRPSAPAAAPRAPIAPVALPPTPVVAPVPPLPPTPHNGDCLPTAGVHDSAWVLVHGDQRSMCGSRRDLRDAERARTSGEDLLWVRLDDDAWVVRDAAILGEARALFERDRERGKQHAELGHKQAALGTEQARHGVAQAELGRKQAELALVQAQLELEESQRELRESNEKSEVESARADASRAQLEAEMASLVARMEDIDRQQHELGLAQEKLGHEQQRLAELEALASHARARVAEQGLEQLFERAREQGKATRIGESPAR